MLQILNYQAEFKNDCLDLVRLNRRFWDFNSSLIREFSNFLDKFDRNNYWCIFNDGHLVGSGGLKCLNDTKVQIVWPVISRKFSGYKAQNELVKFLFKQLATKNQLSSVVVSKNPYSCINFEDYGFTSTDDCLILKVNKSTEDIFKILRNSKSEFQKFLELDISRHKLGDFINLGNEIEFYKKWGDFLPRYALEFWDSWIDEKNHGFPNFSDKIVKQDWPILAQTILEDLNSGENDSKNLFIHKLF